MKPHYHFKYFARHWICFRYPSLAAFRKKSTCSEAVTLANPTFEGALTIAKAGRFYAST